MTRGTHDDPYGDGSVSGFSGEERATPPNPDALARLRELVNDQSLAADLERYKALPMLLDRLAAAEGERDRLRAAAQSVVDWDNGSTLDSGDFEEQLEFYIDSLKEALESGDALRAARAASGEPRASGGKK